jgi:drug/metabolite transporter (DMT)-like permease
MAKNLSINPETAGLIYGFLGVLAFSLTLPATRIAVRDFDPNFVGLGRAFVAGILAIFALIITHQPLPPRHLWGSLLVVVFGVVIGFPLLSTWSMQQLPASQGAIVTGLIPLATAIVATIRLRERPSRLFWCAGILGSTTVVVFALASSGGHIQTAHILLLGASIAAAIGYAEGGKLAAILGGWQVICWALVMVFPFLLAPLAFLVSDRGLAASPGAWLGFGYISIVSQFVGFFAWYHGMHLAGVARVGQIQLLQPFLTVLFSALLLGEKITSGMVVAVCIVIGCVALGRKASIR